MARRAAIGAVLAGGAGRRLGGAKALAELGGRPLVAHAVAAVEGAGLEPVVVAKPGTPLPQLEARLLTEPDQPLHPACGLVAALRISGGRPVVALACDMPFVPSELLAWLAGLPDDVAVAVIGGELQPLLACYRPVACSPLERALAEGGSLRAAVAALRPRLVGEPELRRFGDPERIALNVNSPEDLERARRLLAGRPAARS